jgi:WD repeat-containing protein 35
MPNSAIIGCIAWDQNTGCLCCGAAGGLVKLINIEAGEDGKSSVSTATLEGHQSQGHEVTACCWSEKHNRLTTADKSGHIIVWAQHKGSWVEEMVNNRQCSVVSDMQWAPDGSRICIAYKDGAVIVGKVDGTRVWGKELDLPLDKLTWSPTARNILFTTNTGELYVYDADGNRVSTVALKCRKECGESNIAAVTWCAAMHML